MREQKEIEKAPLWNSGRLSLALTAMLGLMFVYILRINLSIGIVCMVRPSNVTSRDTAPSVEDNTTSVINQTHQGDGGPCGTLEAGKRRFSFNGEFDWPKTLQGSILSSFFYGYIVTQVPGGWLAGRFGGKHVMGCAMMVSIIATMLMPVAARTSPYFLMALRIIMGLAMGVVFPCVQCLWGKWAPPMERTKLVAFTIAGPIVGTVFGMSVSGFLCAVQGGNGWPLLFYLYGGLTFIWWISWNYFVYSTPREHPRITERERDYIMNSVGAGVYTKQRQVPWTSIIRSPPVWAIVTAHVCNNWGAYTILSCAPMYMRDVLKFDIKANGLLSALPYLLMYIAANAGGLTADVIRERKILSTTVVRKIYQGIAFICPAIFIIIMGYMDCDRRQVAVVLLCLTVTSTAMNRSGYAVNHVDIAPKYAGILFGISNTAATVPGMVAPIIAGALTPNGSREEWQRVFFIAGGVYTFGAIIYLTFASGVEQSWANEDGSVIDTITVTNEQKELKPLQERKASIDFSNNKTYPVEVDPMQGKTASSAKQA